MDVTILIISFFGVWLSILGGYCVRGFTKRPEDAKFLGIVPWSIVGVFGYIAIGLSAWLEIPFATYTLVAIALFTTLWLLIFRAIKMKMLCPMCLALYLVNVFMGVYVFSVWRPYE